MSTIAAKTSEKVVSTPDSSPVNPVEQEDVIVRKTYRMAETLKKYPLREK